MVLPAPAGVLYAFLQIPEVYTFVQERSNHIFNRPVKRSCSNVQFVARAVASLPRLGNCYMAVCLGRALYRDDRLFKLVVKIPYIYRPENFLKVSRGMAGFNGLFPFLVLTFKISISNPGRIKNFVSSAITQKAPCKLCQETVE